MTQDICAALPTKLASFRAEARFSTLLYRVTLNAAHDRRRKQATHARAATGWGDWEVNRQAERAEAAAATDCLAHAMTQLPPELRDIVALTLGEDLTQAEGDAILGLSEGTVAWRMAEVKKHLRRLAAKEAMPMTDELNTLRDQLRRPPASDAAGKAAAMRLAMENFDRAHQETAAQPRPIQDSPKRLGFLKGLGTMVEHIFGAQANDMGGTLVL
jgi:RNA polymerase sigma-70 factor (ECF subfamily)